MGIFDPVCDFLLRHEPLIERKNGRTWTLRVLSTRMK